MDSLNTNLLSGQETYETHISGQKGTEIVCRLNTWEQMRAIMGKEFIRHKRKKCIMIVTFMMAFIGGLLSAYVGPLMSFSGITLVANIIGMDVILQSVADRELNFRGTFKLMGMSDKAYIGGCLLFNFSLAMLLSLINITTSAVFILGQGVFQTFQYFGFFFLNVVLFNLSCIMISYCFANMIRDFKNVRTVAQLFVGILMVVPLMLMIKNYSALSVVSVTGDVS